MAFGPYGAFVVSSYAATAVVVALLIGWVAIDYRRQRARLRDFESRGIQRRSSAQP